MRSIYIAIILHGHSPVVNLMNLIAFGFLPFFSVWLVHILIWGNPLHHCFLTKSQKNQQKSTRHGYNHEFVIYLITINILGFALIFLVPSLTVAPPSLIALLLFLTVLLLLFLTAQAHPSTFLFLPGGCQYPCVEKCFWLQHV